MNQELPDIEAGFRKGRGTRDQIANIHWVMKKDLSFYLAGFPCFSSLNSPVIVVPSDLRGLPGSLIRAER